MGVLDAVPAYNRGNGWIEEGGTYLLSTGTSGEEKEGRNHSRAVQNHKELWHGQEQRMSGYEIALAIKLNCF